MSQMTTGRDAGLEPGVRHDVQHHAGFAAIAQGASILTLDGALPVEYLNPGDRIVTRSGAVRLRAVHMQMVHGPMIRVAPSSLGHDRPGHALLLSPDTPVLVRDWRAKVMFGAQQTMVAVSRLVDGDLVTRVSGEGLRSFSLEFDTAQVIYVDGVEVGCAAATAEMAAAAA
ncbi:MAG: Hint domain-containing protein [Rhodobacteraceae bacterium]|nr:Hint domain-containing protein [Paracoccaceae bacterium]